MNLRDWDEAPTGRGMPLAYAIAIWVVALLVLYGAQAAFTAAQMDGEPPAYTCAPGTQYTTKECQ